MRLVTFQNTDAELRCGAIVDGRVIDLVATDPTLPPTVRQILAAGVLDQAASAVSSSKAVTVDKPQLKAPIPDPSKVICIGLNYRDHAKESGAKIPQEPVVFNKFPTAIIGPEEAIRLPKVSSQVDYEAELVIVIGREGHRIPGESAMDWVAGYTVGHDVSARDWQLGKDGRQWLLGKTFDTFAPTGPALVTCDEVPDPHALRIQLRLNGETMQDSITGQMIFRVDHLVSYLSQVMTLWPGDLIFTGTPPGVGVARKPPVFLKPGDVCEVEIDHLGTLRNPCVAAP